MSGPFIEFYKNFNLNIYFFMFAYDVLSNAYNGEWKITFYFEYFVLVTRYYR